MRAITTAASAYRRTALVGLCSTAALLWGLTPAAGQPGSTSSVPFSNGVAKATAVVTKIAPGVGSLELALANGIAVSELKNQLTQAQAQSLDLGLIGSTLTSGSCREASLTPDDLPQPTRADNRKGDAEATSDEAPIAGSTLGAGRESARATATLAEAIATSAAGVSPVVTVSGGRATATTEVIDGAARQAHATVEANLDLAGVLALRGLRWDAVHRTGKDPHAEAGFDVGSASLLGVPLPVESLATLEATLNTALAPTGISVQLPHVERFEEPADLVRVTPLRIVLKDSPVGKTALGPALDLTREQRFNLFNDLAASICDAAGILLVGDIGISIAAGTGFLAVEVGGAEALSDDLIVENPFGAPIAPQQSGTEVPLGPGAIPPVPVARPVPAPLAPPAASSTDEPQAPTASIGPLEELCETIHPRRSPSCSTGAMAPLGLLGLVATAAVAGLDWNHQRRRTAVGAAAVTEVPA